MGTEATASYLVHMIKIGAYATKPGGKRLRGRQQVLKFPQNMDHVPRRLHQKGSVCVKPGELNSKPQNCGTNRLTQNAVSRELAAFFVAPRQNPLSRNNLRRDGRSAWPRIALFNARRAESKTAGCVRPPKPTPLELSRSLVNSVKWLTAQVDITDAAVVLPGPLHIATAVV